MNAQRKMTPKGQMSSSGMGPAIHHLPMHIRALFEANGPLTHLPQLTKRKMPPYAGISDFISQFEKDPPPQRLLSETPKERKERLRAEQIAKHQEKLNQEIAKWDPTAQDDRKTEDAYKTLFVGRISYETTEKQLRHEFEQFGAVKHIRLVEDEEGKSRGYAFIEYEHEADLKAAYKYADGKKIDGRRVVVDVERGRTVHEWRPRKFGGGIGETRKGGPGANVKYSGREPIGEIRFESYHGGGDQARVVNDLVNTPVGIVDDHDHGRNHAVAIENKDVTVVSIKIGMAFVIFAPRGPGKEEYYS
ncbi:hypothetical protein ABG067_001418 [Albugo candida]